MKQFHLTIQETSAIVEKNLGAALRAMDSNETFVIGKSVNLKARMKNYDTEGFKKPKNREESYILKSRTLTAHDQSALEIEAIFQ